MADSRGDDAYEDVVRPEGREGYVFHLPCWLAVDWGVRDDGAGGGGLGGHFARGILSRISYGKRLSIWNHTCIVYWALSLL